MRQLCERLGLADDPAFANALDPSAWPAQRRAVADAIAARPRDHWLAIFEDSDACVAPVLSMGDAVNHPHHRARGAFVDTPTGPVPAPAPRYGHDPLAPATDGEGGASLLAELGYDADQISRILEP